MRTVFVMLALALAAMPAAAESWSHVPLIDRDCVEKVRDDPDRHDTACLIQCAGSGYGILLTDGTYVSFDKAGNDKALAALKGTDKKAGIRVTVSGERNGDEIAVSSLRID